MYAEAGSFARSLGRKPLGLSMIAMHGLIRDLMLVWNK